AMQRAFELARTAVDAGDAPYGTVLVHDEEIIMEERNEVRSSGDLATHPELTIARRVAKECDEETAADSTMVTSTEPCAMCAKGIADTSIAEVVYSVSCERNSELRGLDYPGIPAAEVFDRYGAAISVSGPVLPDAGADVIREGYDIEE
ncbi:MAG: nucleoside deaminase, partial [Salinirussus sp.]